MNSDTEFHENPADSLVANIV